MLVQEPNPGFTNAPQFKETNHGFALCLNQDTLLAVYFPTLLQCFPVGGSKLSE